MWQPFVRRILPGPSTGRRAGHPAVCRINMETKRDDPLEMDEWTPRRALRRLSSAVLVQRACPSLLPHRTCHSCDPAQRGWDPVARVIRIDPADHASDRELCATVLHEMAHVVAGQSAHGVRFWEQVEYLLEQGAPLMLKTGELSGCGATLEVPIPERFVLARQAFEHDARPGTGNQDGVMSRATGTGRKRRRTYYGE